MGEAGIFAGSSDLLTEYVTDLAGRLERDKASMGDLVRGSAMAVDPAEYYSAQGETEEIDAELSAALDLADLRHDIEERLASLPDQEPEWEFPNFGTPEQPLQIQGITGTPSLRPIGDGNHLLTVSVAEATDPPSSYTRQLVLLAGEVALLRWASEPGEKSPRYAFIGTDNAVAAQILEDNQ